jgi:hypothetical protein
MGMSDICQLVEVSIDDFDEVGESDDWPGPIKPKTAGEVVISDIPGYN